MSTWWRQWRGTVLVGVLVLGVASVVALVSVRTVAVVRDETTAQAQPAPPPTATPKAPKPAAKPAAKPFVRKSAQPKPDGGELCRRFSSYREAKRYYDTHPADRAALSWDGDDRPCEDFIARWSQ